MLVNIVMKEISIVEKNIMFVRGLYCRLFLFFVFKRWIIIKVYYYNVFGSLILVGIDGFLIL